MWWGGSLRIVAKRLQVALGRAERWKHMCLKAVGGSVGCPHVNPLWAPP